MTISSVNANTTDTLDQTSATQVDSMTLTPGAGDYFCVFTCEMTNAAETNSHTLDFVITVNSVDVDGTGVRYSEDGVNENVWVTASTSGIITVGASEVVEINYLAGSATTPMVCHTREMVLFPIPTAGTDYQALDTVTDNHVSNTYTTIDNMTITNPDADDYLCVYTHTCNGTASEGNSIRIAIEGTPVEHSERVYEFEASIGGRVRTGMTAVKISPNGSEDVTVEHAVIGTPGAINSFARSLSLIPLDSGDLFESFGTATDTDVTTDAKQIDDMLITSPGADDYLVLFSSHDRWGGISSTVFHTVQFYEGAVAVTDTDRKQGRDQGVDNAEAYIMDAALVTVTGTDNLQMFWDGETTVSRDMEVRALVAIREAAVGGTTPKGPLTNPFSGPFGGWNG